LSDDIIFVTVKNNANSGRTPTPIGSTLSLNDTTLIDNDLYEQ